MNKLNKEVLKGVAPWLVVGGVVCLAYCLWDKDGVDSSLLNVLISGVSSAEDFDVKYDNAIVPQGQDAMNVQGRSPRESEYQDPYGKRIQEVLSFGGWYVDDVKCDIGVLDQLAEERRELLFRYLSAHPGWRLYRDHGGLKAVRRYKFQDFWRLDTRWTDCCFEGWIGPWSRRREFSVRVVLGFDGTRFSIKKYFGADRVDIIKAGKNKLVPTSLDSKKLCKSNIEILGENVDVNILEAQPFVDRRITKAFLALLRDEFDAVAKAKTWDDLKKILPADAVLSGLPSLTLYGENLGEYKAIVRVNPGEYGSIYLKARGLKTGNELWQTKSKGLKSDTNEYVGWSACTNEQFFASSSLTIRDGRGWKTKSPVKMEVWFSPDAGGDDRKLFEKVFMLTSWER